MCTVTYLPKGENDFILTSNRDVSTQRTPASLPALVQLSDAPCQILYPKDGAAGGTWIGGNSRGRVLVLLNGGFEQHEYQPPYARSRGTVVMDFLTATDGLEMLQTSYFNGIEPFTLLLLDWSKGFVFWELVWDGERKFLRQLDPKSPQIWSSATLYDASMRAKRDRWFAEFLQQNPNYTQQDILNFHENGGEGDPWVDILLNRGNMRTVSVSSIQKNEDLLNFFYHDEIADDFANQVLEVYNGETEEKTILK